MLALLLAAQAGCANASTQAEMTRCASEAYRRADATMTAQWKRTNAFMKARDAAETTRGGGPGYAITLLESQRAWLRFRDMQCSAESLRYAGGSMQPMALNQCRARMTDARTQQLKSLVWRG